MFDSVEDFLELLGLFEVDLPLGWSILISISIVVKGILGLFEIFVAKGNHIFTKFLLCTTIQDGGIRERSTSYHTFFLNQQFIIQSVKADHGSYFVTTYM